MKTKAIFILMALVLAGVTAYGQKKAKKITITGYVSDYRQAPVSNAMILIDGEKTNAVTDGHGIYKVKVPATAGTIAVFTLSSGVKEEEIKGRNRIDFVIPVGVESNTQVPQESPGNEVINVGYGNARKKDLTTSVGKIDNTDNKYSTYTNIYDMIRGEVSGVQVQGTSIKIMGVNSLNLSTEPLFVVDGMQVSTISNIPPQAVKSIEILKGSSAAIYGVRGANGVILITTVK